MSSSQSALLSAPIGPTLARMAAPNVIAMFITLATSMAEAWFVGQLGTRALAGLALAFPMLMLTMMLSAGAVGGAISGAVAQRLGAGDRDGAEAVALHAVILSLLLAAGFAALFLSAGPAIYAALGGGQDVLSAALAYSDVLFAGCVTLWLANALSGIIRAAGHMKTAAIGMVMASAVQIPCAGVLIFGIGPFPAMGISGAAMGLVIGFACATVFQAHFLLRKCPELRLRLTGVPITWSRLGDLARVGALASVSPITSIATVIVITAAMARLGVDVLAGYGIGARLEFLMIPLIFGIGAASITMVGVHFGAGEFRRGLRIGWTGAAASAVMTGAIGGLLALFPQVWSDLFTDVTAVQEVCRQYLRIVGPFYAFFGAGLCLYFASQGARRMLWPVIASVLRLAIVFAGALWVARGDASGPEPFFVLIGAAMAIYALVTAIAIASGAWTRGRV